MLGRKQIVEPTTGVIIVGATAHPLRDAYHLLLRSRGSAVVLVIVGAFLSLNALFALLYLLVGGVEHLPPRSFWRAYAFSVQTMSTVGYGAMYPEGAGAHAVVVLESIVGLLLNAVSTGLVFAKFSQPAATIQFSNQVTICPINGVPTLAFRVGNDRQNAVLEAAIRVSCIRTEHTQEGDTFYRMYDLKLARERAPTLSRSWTVLHPITPDSPLAGLSPEAFARDEIELLATVAGTDEVSFQPVHGHHRYEQRSIVWGARHVDILSERPDGSLVLDVSRFHEIRGTAATEAFPYEWKPG